jgi:hypothetical protein
MFAFGLVEGQAWLRWPMFTRSAWRDATSSWDLIAENSLVSSANVAAREDKAASGRSFTYNRKSAGPSIEPCGKPEITGRVLEVTPSTVTRWRWSVKYDSNQFNRLSPIPELDSLRINLLWLIQSKAFDISRYTISTCPTLSIDTYRCNPAHPTSYSRTIYLEENRTGNRWRVGTEIASC